MSEIKQAIPNQPPPPYYYMKPKRTRWWIPVVIIAAIVILFLSAIAVFFSFVGSFFTREAVEVKDNSVIVVNLKEDLREYTTQGPFSFLEHSKKANYLDILTSIERAKNDKRIKGIYIKIGNAPVGVSKMVEMNEVLQDFKKSGKFIYSFIETGNENDYMQALTADKIFMPQEGILEMNGFSASSMFFKDLFSKLGIEFYVQQFEDFKSAGESFNRTGFSDSARKELRSMVQSRYETFVNSVAKYRKLDPEMIKDALSRGIYTADSLKALGFIDDILLDTQVKDLIKAKVFNLNISQVDSKEVNTISINDYANSEPYVGKEKLEKDKQIAIIYASGTIVQRGQLMMNEQTISPSTFIENLRTAREDNNVKLIIIRIDSPGGSVIASEAIWQEIMKTKKVKPVYASMSDVAASGGYYMAMACDTIIAYPTTITGSIGVISMIPNFSGALKNVGITLDTVTTGPESNYMNPMFKFSDKNKEKFRALSQNIYFRFVQKVADSRKMSFERARSLAKGRVWMGSEAVKIGLVDTLTDLRGTLAMAKRRIGVPENMKVRLKIYPKDEDGFKVMIKTFTNSDDESDLKMFTKYFKERQSLAFQFFNTLPHDMQVQFMYGLTLMNIAESEPAIVAMPYMISFN